MSETNTTTDTNSGGVNDGESTVTTVHEGETIVGQEALGDAGKGNAGGNCPFPAETSRPWLPAQRCNAGSTARDCAACMAFNAVPV